MDLLTINQRLASLKASLDALENATTVDARAAEALALAQAAKASAEETLSGSNGATPAASRLFHSAQFIPDGLRVVTACGDLGNGLGYARVWDAQTGQSLTEPLRHQDGLPLPPSARRDCGWSPARVTGPRGCGIHKPASR